MPTAARARNSCAKVRVNPVSAVARLHSPMPTAMRCRRAQRSASTPSGIEATECTSMNAVASSPIWNLLSASPPAGRPAGRAPPPPPPPPPAVLGDDLLGQRQPQAGAALLGREEGLEDAPEVLRRDARAGVGDDDLHGAAVAA